MDQIITIGKSSVQHGAYSDRVYLMHLDPADCPGIMAEIERLAQVNGYSKIFAKVPESHVEQFHAAGYVTEALIPGFFPATDGGNAEDGHFVARYLADCGARKKTPAAFWTCCEPPRVKGKAKLPAKLREERPLERMDEEDAEEMAAFYDSISRVTRSRSRKRPTYVRPWRRMSFIMVCAGKTALLP